MSWLEITAQKIRFPPFHVFLSLRIFLKPCKSLDLMSKHELKKAFWDICMSMSLQSYTFFEQRRSVLLAVLNEEQHRHIKASLGKIDFKKIAGEVDNGQELKKKNNP